MTLENYLQQIPRAALAFSGGSDSAYLLWAAKQQGCDIHPFFLSTPFQPSFERTNAEQMARLLRVPLTVLEMDILTLPEVRENGPERCYYCKHLLFSKLWEEARAEGYPILLDGTNASDKADERPGMRALVELGVQSPLRECGLTKPEIRRRSREAGLFTWDQASYSCLATRIPTGTAIVPDMLHRVERAENILSDLGLSNLRVRLINGAARIQLPAEQMAWALKQREEIMSRLRSLFSAVCLDLEARTGLE